MSHETTRRTFLSTAAVLPALAAPTFRINAGTTAEARRLVAEWRVVQATAARASAEYRSLLARGAAADVLEAAARRSDAAGDAELEALDRIVAHAPARRDAPAVLMTDGHAFVAVVDNNGEIYCRDVITPSQVISLG